MLNHFDDVVILRKVTPIIKDGFSTKTVTTNEVWAEKQSASRSEFYAAAGINRTIDAVFIINACDFNDEEELEHNGAVYDVVRAFQSGVNTTRSKGLGLDLVQLNCERRRTK